MHLQLRLCVGSKAHFQKAYVLKAPFSLVVLGRDDRHFMGGVLAGSGLLEAYL